MANMPTPEIDFVLVTGAGASREFGIRGAKLPLMNDWAKFLIQMLIKGGGFLTEASGLKASMSGEEFENQLGKLLAQIDHFMGAEGLIEVSSKFASSQQIPEPTLMNWYRTAQGNFRQIVNIIRQSLFEKFNDQQINASAASQAYGELFNQLKIDKQSRVVYVTTNYDSIGEHAMGYLGRVVDSGEPRGYGPEQNVIQVNNLLDSVARYTPVLHLHGKIGWFRRDDDPVPRFTGAANYDPGFGTPIVMLPDPEKSYAEDDVLTPMWSHFEAAVKKTARVLVLGHSLADRLLVKALSDNVPHPRALAITIFSDETGRAHESAVPLLAKIRDVFPQAATIPMRFGANPSMGAQEIQKWLTDTAGLGIGRGPIA